MHNSRNAFVGLGLPDEPPSLPSPLERVPPQRRERPFFSPLPSRLRRATFPEGEGFAPLGAVLALSFGEGAARRRRERPFFSPLPSRLRRATFPEGEGFAPRALSLPSPSERVPPAGGGRGRFFHLFRHGYAVPPSPRGKALRLRRTVRPEAEPYKGCHTADRAQQGA